MTQAQQINEKTPQGVGLTCQPNGEKSCGLRAPRSTRQSLASGVLAEQIGRAGFDRERFGGAENTGTARGALFQALYDVAF